jgi:hypothetical protein
MTVVTLRTHTVRSGESLSSIAKSYNVSSWKLIYYAAANDNLRQRRPDPNRIGVGDVVVIPPNIRDVLKERLKRLEELRTASERLFTEQKQKLDAEFAKIKKTGMAIDMAAILASAVGGIVMVTKAYHASLKLSGAALAEANALLLKGALSNKVAGTFTFTFGAPGLADLVGIVVTNTTGELTGNEGLTWALTRIVIDSAMDTVSPSFWARALASRTLNPAKPEAVHSESLKALESARKSVLQQLDPKITKTRQMLADYESQILTMMRTA